MLSIYCSDTEGPQKNISTDSFQYILLYITNIYAWLCCLIIMCKMCISIIKVKGKAVLLQAWSGPEGFRKLSISIMLRHYIK